MHANHSSRALVATTLGVLAMLTLPLALAEFPAFLDYHNHMARHYIEREISQSNSLASIYDFNWRMIPNMAGDVIAVPLVWLLPVYDAERVVVGFAMVLWLLAPMLLHRAIWHRFSYWPLFASLLVYNANLTLGFENYLISSALAVLALALWITLAQRSLLTRFVLFTPVATLVYFGHLVAFGLLGLMIISYGAGRLLGRKSGGRGLILWCLERGLPFLPGATHFVYLILTADRFTGSETIFGYGRSQFTALISLTGPVEPYTDGVLLMIILVIFWHGYLRGRWLRLDPDMLPVILLLGIIALLMPHRLFGVEFVQVRIPFVVAILAIAGARADLASEFQRRAVVGAFALALTIRMVSATIVWRQFSEESRELIAAFSSVKVGSTVLGAMPANLAHFLRLHMTNLAVIERQAFTPTMFTGVTMLSVQPRYLRIDHPHPPAVYIEQLRAAVVGKYANAHSNDPLTNVFWRTWWRDFEFVVIFDDKTPANPFPKLMTEVASGSFFAIYRTVRPSG